MNLILTRVYVGQEGAFGTIAAVNQSPFGVTLEHTYEAGEAVTVKIPPGTYVCQRTRFARGGYETFEITGVAGRDRLLFHKGNTVDDSEGCVLLGLQYGSVNGKPAVLQSQSAFTFFMARQNSVDSFTLEVRNV